MGRSFRLRQPETLQASAVLQRLQTRLKAYGVLYAITSPPGPGVPVVYLLAVKHHKQLSFDLQRYFLSQNPR